MSHSNLRHAAGEVLATWEKGDLAAAMRQLQEAYDADTDGGGAPEDPALAIHMEGGLIHAIYTNVADDLKVLVIDYDTEGCDLDKLPTFPNPVLSPYDPTARGYCYSVTGPADSGEQAEYRFETLIRGASYVEKLCEIAEQHDRRGEAAGQAASVEPAKQPYGKFDEDLVDAHVSRVPPEEEAEIVAAVNQPGGAA